MSKPADVVGVSPAPSTDDIENLQSARSRRARECMQELEILAGRYVELARHLMKPIRDIRKEAGRTTASDRDLILSALEDTRHTYMQIAKWTDLPYQTVYKLLHQSPLVHLVEFRKNPPLASPGRGGPRRAEILIFLRHSGLESQVFSAKNKPRNL